MTTVGFLLGLGAMSGCKCGDDAAKKSATAQAPAAADGSQGSEKKALDPEAAQKRAEALRRMRLAPMSLEEVQPLIPTIPGATAIGKPGILTESRQAKAVLCLTSPSADVAMTQLIGAIGALGFTGVKTRPHPQVPDRLTLHAEKQPFQLGATVQKATTPDCPGDKGKIKVVLSYFKRVTTTPQPAPTPATP